MPRNTDRMTEEMVAQLRGYVARITNIKLEMMRLKEEESQLYAEAKFCGFDPKILRRVVNRRFQMEAPKKAKWASMDDSKTAMYEAVLDD